MSSDNNTTLKTNNYKIFVRYCSTGNNRNILEQGLGIKLKDKQGVDHDYILIEDISGNHYFEYKQKKVYVYNWFI